MIVSDVNPGAEVVAAGDIVVMGSLRGVAHAGAEGDASARIIAVREILPDQRFIDNGSVIVSAGISAGIDMCLYVVARLHGEEIASRTARYMEYPFDE